MASAFGHALTAYALGSGYNKGANPWKFTILGIFCSVIPDADVLSFRFGIAYGDFWGHRGFTHSISFAILLAVIITMVFYNKELTKQTAIKYMVFFAICAISHGILDMMTDGGLGVAIFSPFDTTRYFLPWRPIKVSPMSVSRFFSYRGFEILKSEFIWIGIPCIIYIIFIRALKRSRI